MSILKGYLTPAEAAVILKKSEHTVRRYIRLGQLPHVDDRGRKHIPADALKGFTPPPVGNPTFGKK